MNNRRIYAKEVCFFLGLLFSFYSCKKNTDSAALRYFEVGFDGNAAEWKDSSFVVATNNMR